LELWHFTSLAHLPLIIGDARLTTTESNVGSGRPEWPPFGDRLAADVLWCFDSPTPVIGDRRMLTGGLMTVSGPIPVDKRLVRFTIDVPTEAVVAWVPWARAAGISEEWLASLTANNPGDGWRCILREVPAEEWVAVDWRPHQRARWRPVVHRAGVVLDPSPKRLRTRRALYRK
jgi:hypothetical protein